MKAIITQKSELNLNLLQHFTFDILDDKGEVLLSDQTVQCSPSTAVEDIKSKVSAYEEEYEKSKSLEVGTEIE